MSVEAPTFGLRRGSLLCIVGGGYRGAVFHLGALTRLNEVGLLGGTETICAVAGGSVLAALLATRVPWPLAGAFRDWPEEIAEPMREIAQRGGRRRALLGGSIAGAGAAAQERFARELAGWPQGAAPEQPQVVFGAAGLELGQMARREVGEGEVGLRWELPDSAPRDRGLAALGEEELAAVENLGYRLADRALREGAAPTAAIEPLPPQPPHRHRTGVIPPRRSKGRQVRLRRSGSRGPASGAATAAGGAGELLRRHRPFVQHDSLESYRPDSVATIAELAVGSRCNTLHRADGELLASVHPLEGVARLDLGYLGGPTYADGQPAHAGDYLDESGGSHADDALAIRRLAGREQVVYGRAASSGERLWLQYWLFYYYNDKGFLEAGRHEGDWEIVQLRIGAGGSPDAATYGRHGEGERASWAEVERRRGGEGEAPVVYCARGSHAALLRPGTHPAPAVPDHNDGLGPCSRPRLVEIGAEAPDWVRWPGRWGSTRRREAFEGDSPRGPAQQAEWQYPAEFHATARALAEAPRWREPPPATPRFEARREGNHVVLSYRFAEPLGEQAAAARIVAAAVGGEGENEDGSVVHSFGIDGSSGVCALPAPVNSPLGGVRVSVASELGTPGPTVTVPISS